MHPDEAKFQKWARWIDAIRMDVQSTLLNRYVYGEVQKVIAANTRIHQSSAFYEWMAVHYAAMASVGIRRQLDLDPDSISLARLLTEIKANPTVLSRARFVDFFTKAGYSPEIGERNFDLAVGEGCPHVPSHVVEAELLDFQTKAATVKAYTNKRIAHFDKTGPKDLPTYGDLDACMDCMEHLVKRYTLLLTGQSYVNLVPTFVYDWKEIFHDPWIESPPDKEEESGAE